MPVTIHLTAALCVLVLGGGQLLRPKGTTAHKLLGRLWMGMMVVAAVSSFRLHGTNEWFMGFGPIHILSVWVLVCVVVSVSAARRGNIRRHRGFAVGAFWGTVGAGIGALAVPGRLLHQWLFG